MQVFIAIAYFVVSTIQLFAVVDGISYALGIGRIISFIVAIFVTYVPLLGSALGVYGAVNAWDWTLLQAATLFFWYVPVMILITLYSMAFDR